MFPRRSPASLAAALAALLLLASCRSEPSADDRRAPGDRRAARRAEGRPAPRPMPRPIRAVWVARFHYRTPEDIREIMQTAAQFGFNTVLWQVRGEATVAYPSRIEPWAKEYGHRDPGYDPLAIAVSEAHRSGLRIEAWVNVMPGWYGLSPPPIRDHVYHRHPDWFLYDAAGRRQPLNDHYVILNPCLPEVRRHIVSVCAEIASQYDVDGLHLDYVRFAWDKTPGARDRFPRDARTVAIYRQQTGRDPDDDATAWRNWRANQVTLLVDQIRHMLRTQRPGATLTAATWGDPSDGYQQYLQNATGWAEAGLVDAVYPMAYREDLATFERNIAAYTRSAPSGRVVPGLGIYLHKRGEQTAAQLEACERMTGGDFACFSYESLFPLPRERAAGRLQDRTAAELEARRQAVMRMMSGR